MTCDVYTKSLLRPFRVVYIQDGRRKWDSRVYVIKRRAEGLLLESSVGTRGIISSQIQSPLRDYPLTQFLHTAEMTIIL